MLLLLILYKTMLIIYFIYCMVFLVKIEHECYVILFLKKRQQMYSVQIETQQQMKVRIPLKYNLKKQKVLLGLLKGVWMRCYLQNHK